MANIPITMDQLAKMIDEGFKIPAAKADVAALRSEINEKLEAVESRLSRIEHLLMLWKNGNDRSSIWRPA
jgi:hypothetical protein